MRKHPDSTAGHARARIQVAAATLRAAQAAGTRTAMGAALDLRDEVIREAYLDGVNTHAIVQLFEASGWPISRITVTRAHHDVERPPLFDITDATTRYRAGESLRDLGRAYRCSDKFVRTALTAAGVELRGRGEAQRTRWAKGKTAAT